jgi:hypothetical protein
MVFATAAFREDITPHRKPRSLRLFHTWMQIRGLAMTGRKRAGGEKKTTTVVANHPDDLKDVLKQIGGSRSDHWNHVLASQAIQTLWLKHSDKESCDQQYSATVAALIGIGPRDELEAMIAAQLLAAHNAAMECYRRAMLFEQTFEGCHEILSQANKLSRTDAALLDALNRHRGKGQQKVTVEHVHVNRRRSSYSRCRPPVGSDKREIGGTNRCTARNYPCTGHCVAVLGPGAGIPANRQRREENGAVECMEGRPEAVLPSATRTPSGMVAIQQKKWGIIARNS